MVSALERPLGIWRRHSGPMHQVLEHDAGPRAAIDPDRILGVQPHVQPQFAGTGEHPRLLGERGLHLEVPQHAQDLDIDRAQPESALPGDVPGWRKHRDWRGRRDAPLLESVPQNEKNRKAEVADPGERIRN